MQYLRRKSFTKNWTNSETTNYAMEKCSTVPFETESMLTKKAAWMTKSITAAKRYAIKQLMRGVTTMRKSFPSIWKLIFIRQQTWLAFGILYTSRVFLSFVYARHWIPDRHVSTTLSQSGYHNTTNIRRDICNRTDTLCTKFDDADFGVAVFWASSLRFITAVLIETKESGMFMDSVVVSEQVLYE